MRPDARLYDLEGWLSRPEGDKLCELASQVEPGRVIVELGSFRGKSSCFLAHGSRAGNMIPVFCVDLWWVGGQWESDIGRRARDGGGPPQHHNDPEHYNAFKVQTDPYCDLIFERVGDTAQVAKRWTDGPVGLLFVDADHSHEGTLDDLNAWSPLLAPGAVVVCHDYHNDDYPGVRQATDEWLGERSPTSVETVDSMLVVKL